MLLDKESSTSHYGSIKILNLKVGMARLDVIGYIYFGHISHNV